MKSVAIPEHFSGRLFEAALGIRPEALDNFVVNVPDSYAGDLTEFVLSQQDRDDRAEENEATAGLLKAVGLLLHERAGNVLTGQQNQYLEKSRRAIIRMAQRGDI